MRSPIEVPTFAELEVLGVVPTLGDEPGVVQVELEADDGDRVVLVWDTFASSVNVWWLQKEVQLLVLERETVTKVAVQRVSDGLFVRISSRSEGILGELEISVGKRVSVRDALLRH